MFSPIHYRTIENVIKLSSFMSIKTVMFKTAIFINPPAVLFPMSKEESPGKHGKHSKEVQELWEEIERREKESHKEAHDEEHKDYEEEVLKEEGEEKEEE